MTTRARADHAPRTHPALQIVPLGGLGEFGNNCAVLRYGGDMVVIDAGLSFPEEQFLGGNCVIPDFGYITERAAEVRGILLTHRHEDHIRAPPYLYPKVPAPRYGR